MDNELKRLLEFIDKAMSTAEQLKKSTNGSDLATFDMAVDSYCKSLETLHNNANSLSPEAGDIPIPNDLLDMISLGLRKDDFNNKLKENIDKKINSFKSICESFSTLEKSLEPSDSFN